MDAQAAIRQVPSSQYPTIADAVDGAPNDTEIVIAPGSHLVSSTININNRRLIIRGEQPPFEISDPDSEINTYVEADWLGGVDAPDGLFRLTNDANVTFRNLVFKGIEVYCEDEWDNDDNGLKNGADPACSGDLPGDTGRDTSGGSGLAFPDIRAIYGEDGSTIVLDATWIQGYSYKPIGSAIYVINSTLEVNGSLLHSNFSYPVLTPSAWWEYGQGGAIAADRSTVLIANSTLSFNHAWQGGAIYARNQGSVTIDQSVVWLNYGNRGGGLFVEDRNSLTITRSQIFGNLANLVIQEASHFPHEGGAIFMEDGPLILKNNVFAGNESLGYAGAVLARESRILLYPAAPAMTLPDIQFNTFFENNAAIGASVLLFDGVEFLFRNNVALDNFATVLGAWGWTSAAPPDVEYNDFRANLGSPSINPEFDGVFGGDLVVYPVSPSTNISDNPVFMQAPSGVTDYDWRAFRFYPSTSSPVIDAADPALSDVGGSRADMGAYGGPGAQVVDNDLDGWVNIYDCNDFNRDIFPFNAEPCDGLDNNCNGIIDDFVTAYFPDLDYDGHGDFTAEPLAACPEDELPPLTVGLWVGSNDDCDDTNPRVAPGTPEYCDAIDNDCDGRIDEEIPVVDQWPDDDMDGFGNGDPTELISVACPPPGYSPFGTDCNDFNPDIHPLITPAARIHSPLADSDLETSEASRDASYVADGVDQDCDGVDICYADFDGDGFGAEPLVPGELPELVKDNDLICANLSSLTATNSLDCSDRDPLAYPGAPEIPADAVDQNCDGQDTCFEDLDEDGYGSAVIVPDNNLDCNDPSARTSSFPGDCLDVGTDAAQANPERIEICDGVDNNCDGQIDELTTPSSKSFYRDADGDGYGDINQRIQACGSPDFYVERAGDCNDSDPRAYPQASEQCDEIDNDCDGTVDETDAIDVQLWYEDVDGDGWGNQDLFQESCNAPETTGAWVPAGRPLDCNDADPLVGPCAKGCSYANRTSPASLALSTLVALLAAGMSRRRVRS